MNPIQLKTVSLYDTQQAVLTEILDAQLQSGEIKSQAEYQAQYQSSLARITPNQPLFRAYPQSGQTNSDLYNQAFSDLSFDMQVIFQQLNWLGEMVSRHRRLNLSILNTIQGRMDTVNQTLTKYEQMASVANPNELYIEDFSTASSFSSDSTLYTERDNTTVLPSSSYLTYDAERNALKLPLIDSQNTLIGPGGIHLGQIRIIKQLGADMMTSSNPNNDITKIIDTSNDTYWSERIFTDFPFSVDMGDTYFGVDSGALVQVEIAFDYLTQMNEIGLSVFGEYPLDLVAVQYFETDDASESPLTLFSPSEAATPLATPVSDAFDTILGSASYQFNDIFAKRLRILFNQRHYTKENILISSQQQQDLSLWFNARVPDLTLEEPEGTIFLPVYLNKQEQDPGWFYLKQQIQNGSLDVQSALGLSPTDKTTAVTKYMYTYGLYNLSLRKNDYDTTGVYVSQPILVDGNLHLLSLTTDETHPSVSGMNPFTDIEYSVYDGSSWYPILPTNVTDIQSERLLPVYSTANSAWMATLRMSGTGVAVYQDGTDITSSVTISGTSITIPNYDSASLYTASYVPNTSYQQMDFLKAYTDVSGNVNPKMLTETFDGTDPHGLITLGYYPFVDRAKLNQQSSSWNPTYLVNQYQTNGYLPIEVRLIDPSGNFIGQSMYPNTEGIRVDNVTDYASPSNSILQPYDGTSVFYEYMVSGNTIQFNTPIPQGTRIVVNYPNLVGSVQLKAIMRQNAHGISGLTPTLHQFTMRLQTLQ